MKRIYTHMMDDNRIYRDGALPVEARQADGVPGPLPRRGPTLATGGHRTSGRGVRNLRLRANATGQNTTSTPRPLNIIQWNAEGVGNKKVPLTERLHKECIDIACIQETHLTPSRRFNIRGYETLRHDREGRQKGGTLILVRNSLIPKELKVDTNQQSEVHGACVTIGNKNITIYNLYCPADRELQLHSINMPSENCLILGDFNSRSTCWGYEDTDRRGDEVEDWQIDNKLSLLNMPDDTPTFYSRRWLSTTTPDLAFATDDLCTKTTRTVLDPLGGSDHRPVKLSINLNYKPPDSKTFPRWNYKKADWGKFKRLTDKFSKSIKPADQNINRATTNFQKALLQAATESIPRGARKNYKPYWTEELQDLEDQVNSARQTVEETPNIENNIRLKALTAKYTSSYKQGARDSWIKKTESLNFDKEGQKLWKLTKALNDENTKAAPITLQKEQHMITGKDAANVLADRYEQVSNIEVPEERKQKVMSEQRQMKVETADNIMDQDYNLEELEEALKVLNDLKSPGPDKITNAMLTHMGNRAKAKLLGIFNNSWRTGQVPQAWRVASMVPILKKGKDRSKADSYRPISLTSCIGKVFERMVNSRLTWHLERHKLICDEQAGFRPHRSTEDQVTYISQKIEDGFQERKHTLAVWIDLEKAFDKVWKEGLKLKLKQHHISGKMYTWISQFLSNRKARVQVNGQYSREKILKEGVPQGGVLSPTLFLIYINDILNDLPKHIHSAIYADDLVLWSTEESLATANYRIQEALRAIENWTKRWIVTINASKTTYTIFSMSTKTMTAKLTINGERLPKEDNPTYLGVTFDKRLTWKAQTEKTQATGKVRLALMKKLTSTSWGADARILTKLHVGRVRPTLEYGVTAWGTAAKSNFDRVSKVQNQAARIITGAMQSTPIHELETITGLQSIETRRDTKILCQAAKFKRLTNHPMKKRMDQPAKKRLKRGSFIHQSRDLEKRNQELLKQEPLEIPLTLESPAWTPGNKPSVCCEIDGVGSKNDLNELELKARALELIHDHYPQESWTQVYTDGSAEHAVKNGGAGTYVKFPGGKEARLATPTGQFSTNYKAEAEAIIQGVRLVKESPHTSCKIVFLSDAKSVLQAVGTNKDKNLNELLHELTSLAQTHTVALQWIPSHCGIAGNEIADQLAKRGATEAQTDKSTTYGEARTLIKASQHSNWLSQHPKYNKADPYYLLTRAQQVVIFRLRTGHNRMNYHLFTKLKIGQTDQCPCKTGSMTTEHLLQSCPLHTTLRNQFWDQDTPLQRKLYGSLEDLHRTAAFADRTGASI